MVFTCVAGTFEFKRLCAKVAPENEHNAIKEKANSFFMALILGGFKCMKILMKET